VLLVQGASVEDEDELVVPGVIRIDPGDEQKPADRRDQIEFFAQLTSAADPAVGGTRNEST
jgi:hypothetical protein